MKNTIFTLVGIFLILINLSLCFSQVGVGQERMLIKERVLENPFEREEKTNWQFSDKRDSIRSSLMPQKPKAIISITGKVFVDFNENQIFDDEDIVLSDIEVSLYSDEGFVHTTLTNNNGIYFFGVIEANSYTITLDNLPEEILNCSPNEVSFIPNTNQSLYEADFCVSVVGAGSPVVIGEGIGGIVYFDENRNKKLDEDEIGIANIKIFLKDINQNTIDISYSNENGEYFFPTENLEVGTTVFVEIDNLLQGVSSESSYEVTISENFETIFFLHFGVTAFCEIENLEMSDCIDNQFSLFFDVNMQEAPIGDPGLFVLFLLSDDGEGQNVGTLGQEYKVDGLPGYGQPMTLRVIHLENQWCAGEIAFEAPCCIPNPSLITNSRTICENQSFASLNTFVETPNDATLGTWSGPGVENNRFIPSMVEGTGPHTVTYTTLCSETEELGTVELQITLEEEPFILITPPPSTVCNTLESNNINLSNLVTFSNNNVTWEINPSSSALQQNNQGDFILNPSEMNIGEYELTYEAGNLCKKNVNYILQVENCNENCAEIAISDTAQQLNYTDLWTFEVNNESLAAMEVRFEVEVFDEEKGITVYKAQTENVSLPAGGERYNKINYHQLGKITLDEEIMNGNQFFIKALSATQKVPPSTYRITVRTLDEDMNICSEFSSINSVRGIKTFTSITPPILTHPFNGDTISNNLPLFTWEATAPIEADRYYFKMVEVLQGNTPIVAIENSAYWREEVINPKTQVFYDTNARPLEVGKTYAWRVVPEFDQASNLPTPSSEIYTFTYHPTIDKEDTLNIVEQLRVCDFEIEKNLRMIAKTNSRKKKKIKAALVYTNIHPQDTLLPWKLTVDYEIRFKDREEVELGQFVVSPQRPIDVYEIFDEEPYFFDKEAILTTNEVSLTVTNVQRFPIANEIPSTICLELSIEEDERRHEKLSDFLLNGLENNGHEYIPSNQNFDYFHVFPNKPAFALLYHLNPELLYQSDVDLDKLIVPKIDKENKISKAIFEETIRKPQNDNQYIGNYLKKIEAITNVKNSYRRNDLKSIQDFLTKIYNGKLEVSDVSLEHLIERMHVLIDLIRKKQGMTITVQESNALKSEIDNMLLMPKYYAKLDEVITGYNSLEMENDFGYLDKLKIQTVANDDSKSISNLQNSDNSRPRFNTDVIFVKAETLNNKNEQEKVQGYRVKCFTKADSILSILNTIHLNAIKEFKIPSSGLSTPLEHPIPIGTWILWMEEENFDNKLGIVEERILLPEELWVQFAGFFTGYNRKLELYIDDESKLIAIQKTK